MKSKALWMDEWMPSFGGTLLTSRKNIDGFRPSAIAYLFHYLALMCVPLALEKLVQVSYQKFDLMAGMDAMSMRFRDTQTILLFSSKVLPRQSNVLHEVVFRGTPIVWTCKNRSRKKQRQTTIALDR